MEKKKSPTRGKGGRPAKNDTATHCVMVRFTDQEYARFYHYTSSPDLAKAVFPKETTVRNYDRIGFATRSDISHYHPRHAMPIFRFSSTAHFNGEIDKNKEAKKVYLSKRARMGCRNRSIRR